jgi:hypothetical protein
MTVYVDGIFEWTPDGKQAARHGKKWCHLAADSTAELVAPLYMAVGIDESDLPWFAEMLEILDELVG